MSHSKTYWKQFNLIHWLFPMKEQKLLFFSSLAFIPLIVFIAYESSFAKVCMFDPTCEVPNLGLSFFYRDVQEIGFNLLYAFLLLLLIPNLYAYQTLKEKHNSFNTMIIHRISFKKYFKREIINNFVKTFIVVMLIYIYTLIIINFFVPIKFNFSSIDWNYVYDPAYQRYYELFSNNSFVSTMIYIIFVSLGYAVFSSFVLSLQFFVNNLYIFRIIGIVVLIVGVAINAFITSLVANIIGAKIATLLFAPFTIGFLLNPGIMNFGSSSPISSIAYYFITVLTYLIITNILFKVAEKRWMDENV